MNKSCFHRGRRLPGIALTCAMALALAQACSKDSPSSAAKSSGSSDRVVNADNLLITGSSTMAPLMDAVGKRFQALHPGVKIEVQAGGSSRGVSDARSGRAHIGTVSRVLKDDEYDLQNFAMARDGVALIIHKENPIQTLTNKQIADLYAGKIADWKDLGGRRAPIVVFYPPPGMGSYEPFMAYFRLREADLKSEPRVEQNEDRVKAVTENPNAIVYISVGHAERAIARGAPLKLLPLAGVAATSMNVRRGDFPISRSLTLVTKQPPAGLVKDFIEFALSSAVRNLVEEYGFVSYMD